MASEITYAEVRFQNESKSSSTYSDSRAASKVKSTPHSNNPGFLGLLFVSLLILFLLLAIVFFVAFIIFFQKYSQLLEGKNSIKEMNHTELNCIKNHLPGEDKVWSCCPEEWKPFSSDCYFISTDSNSWHESKDKCSKMGAHLLVIRSKEEQDFIIRNLDTRAAYYVGLSDPKGQGQWQWVDQTPYNQSATFWHSGEPNGVNEHCVVINNPYGSRWGWNDVLCNQHQRSICQMKKTYL
ncbi:C-type lectin domain family 4 member A-like [Nannospalax galili]|uniref:C-type lectin domain family 4 member A-like n=1 Tax=Nannospalax galili TaxID=1026970 RepID=A0A8C6QR87_NANGA|nr:C-type lectin domain family 4 member A-like [Nannospalax galili]